MPGLTETLAGLVSRQSLDSVPQAALRVAKQCLLDWTGVAIAGRGEPLVRILIEDALEDSAGDGASIIAAGSACRPCRRP